MRTIQSQVEQYETHIVTVKAFTSRFGPLIPEGFPVSVCLMPDPYVNISIPSRYQSQENTDKMLAACGDIFGREGWTESLAYDRESYDWTREIDGVRVKINSARSAPKENDRPVPPGLFPVLIADKSE